MPPTIDPISNLFSTGLGMFGRALIFLLAGMIGILVGEVSAAFTLTSLTDLVGTFEALVAEFDQSVVIYCLCWPIMVTFRCLFDIPLYALVLLIVTITCFFKMVVQDDPPMFWALILMIFVALVPLLTNGTWYSLIPFGMFMIAVGAGIYYVVSRDYPEWIDKIRDLNTQKEKEDR